MATPDPATRDQATVVDILTSLQSRPSRMIFPVLIADLETLRSHARRIVRSRQSSRQRPENPEPRHQAQLAPFHFRTGRGEGSFSSSRIRGMRRSGAGSAGTVSRPAPLCHMPACHLRNGKRRPCRPDNHSPGAAPCRRVRILVPSSTAPAPLPQPTSQITSADPCASHPHRERTSVRLDPYRERQRVRTQASRIPEYCTRHSGALTRSSCQLPAPLRHPPPWRSSSPSGHAVNRCGFCGRAGVP